MMPASSYRGRRGTPLYIVDTAQGLASNQVHRLASDAQSRLWLASPVGLARFDGDFVEHWDRRRGLQCNGLRTVAIATTGHIWVGTDLGLEILDLNGQAALATAVGVWRFGLCQQIDLGGPSPWLGTAHGLVRLVAAGDGKLYRPDFVADIGFVNDVKTLATQHVLAASAGQGLVESDGKTWWRYRCEALAGRQALRLAVGDPAGAARLFYVGTDQGLWVIDDTTATVVARLAMAGVDPAVTAVALGADRIWVAFGRVLVAFSTALEQPQVLECFDVESPVNDLMLDALHNVWLATNNSGLAQVSCFRAALRRIDLGHPGGVFSIKPSRGTGDQVWLGGEQLFGSAQLTPEHEVVTLRAPQGLPDTVVWDSLQDNSGVWAATQAGLYHAPAGHDFVQAFASDAVIGAPCRVLMQRGDALWVGSLRGLACIRGGEVAHVEADGASLGYVYALSLDDDGALWIATLGRGLWREQAGLRPVHSAPLNATGNTYAVVHGAAGSAVVVQDDNLVLLARDMSARLIVQLPPVAGWALAWVDAQTLALGASDGLRLVDLASGRVTQHIQALLRLRDWEFTNNRTLVRDRHGAFLCGLSGGLLRLRLDLLQAYAPPVCKLAELSWTGASPTQAQGRYHLRPGRWSVRLRAYCAWFVDTTQLRYQFQLLGFDADWTALQDRPELSFNSLPPGEYRLMARAFSPLVGLGPEVELLHLVVTVPFWAIGWVAVLAATETLYERIVLSRKRNQTMLANSRRLEQAVAERTQSLRAANQELETLRDAYQRLSEVDALTQVGNRRLFDREMTRNITLARRLLTPVSLLMVDIDHFKSVNDKLGHAVGDTYLRAVAQALVATVRTVEDVVARFGGEEFAVVLQNTGQEAAAATAERVRAAVQALHLRNETSAVAVVTVSIGVATCMPGRVTSAEELTAHADRALYRAKREGRNRVVIASPSAAP
jgi:diguanylate cyclase (GGDEF)-like protein